jgi:hypothetical protein
MILNNRYEEPYNKFPKDGPIPLLSKSIVKSKLSKKFWLYSQYLQNENLINNEDDFSSLDNYNINNNDNEENNNININNNNKEYPQKNYINNNYINDIKFPNNRKVKTPGNKLNNFNKYKINDNNLNEKRNIKKKTKNNNFNDEVNEINRLNDIIYELQCELNRQDFIINNQINEKKKLQKRIIELEQIIKNFC